MSIANKILPKSLMIVFYLTAGLHFLSLDAMESKSQESATWQGKSRGDESQENRIVSPASYNHEEYAQMDLAESLMELDNPFYKAQLNVDFYNPLDLANVVNRLNKAFGVEESIKFLQFFFEKNKKTIDVLEASKPQWLFATLLSDCRNTRLDSVIIVLTAMFALRDETDACFLAKMTNDKQETLLHQLAANNVKSPYEQAKVIHIMRLLIKHGGTDLIFARDVTGKTALHVAACVNNLHVASCIIEFCSGRMLNTLFRIFDNDGCTAFHSAAANGYLVALLMIQSIDPDAEVPNVMNDAIREGCPISYVVFPTLDPDFQNLLAFLFNQMDKEENYMYDVAYAEVQQSLCAYNMFFTQPYLRNKFGNSPKKKDGACVIQ